MHTIALVMGDWSHDGHGLTETVNVRCNVDREELLKAYTLGVEISGVDLKGDVACDWEDSSLPEDILKTLEELGYDSSELVECGTEFVDQESYWRIWMFIAKVGNPAIEFEQVHNLDIKIGGYGLFTS